MIILKKTVDNFEFAFVQANFLKKERRIKPTRCSWRYERTECCFIAGGAVDGLQNNFATKVDNYRKIFDIQLYKFADQ